MLSLSIMERHGRGGLMGVTGSTNCTLRNKRDRFAGEGDGDDFVIVDLKLSSLLLLLLLAGDLRLGLLWKFQELSTPRPPDPPAASFLRALACFLDNDEVVAKFLLELHIGVSTVITSLQPTL